MLQGNMMVHAMAGVLGLKKPIEIRLTTSQKGFQATGHKESIAAFYESRMRKNTIIKHVIFVNLEIVVTSAYTLADTIGHELCHACQFENGIFNDNRHHDKKFQKLCEYLETEMRKLGFKLGPLYNSETDVD